jgi:hypothetical protein
MVPPDVDDLGRVVEVFIGPLMPGMDNITVLTQKAVCVSALDLNDLKRAPRRLEVGTPVRQVLGQRTKVITLAALQAVKMSNKQATLSLGYMEGERRAQHTIQFMQPQQRKVYTALGELLGPDWEEVEKPSTVWSALSLPLLLGGFVLFFAFIGFMAARQQESGFVSNTARGQAGGAMAALIGPLGWAIVGSLAIAGSTVWGIYAILTRPPAEVVLTRPGLEDRVG